MSTPTDPTLGWHVDPAILARYAVQGVSPAVAASTEAHLVSCADCRARVTAHVSQPRLDLVWQEIEESIDLPPLPWFERLLVRVGIREDTARLLSATPSLSSAWLGALAVSVAFAVVAADVSPRGLFFFLTLAPMLPVAGVAAAYGRDADPAYELAVASPYSLLRLLLVRSIAVVGTTVALVAVGGLLLADVGWTAAGWLLPALALTLTTLALSARVAPVWAAAAVLVSWVALVVVAWQSTGSRLAAWGDVGQLAALAVTAVAAAALTLQRNTFAYDTRRSS